MDGSGFGSAVRQLRGKMSQVEAEISQRESNLNEIEVRLNGLDQDAAVGSSGKEWRQAGL
jgi:uncharacterized protein involved in exopolysaccharide biosynthesis